MSIKIKPWQSFIFISISLHLNLIHLFPTHRHYHFISLLHHTLVVCIFIIFGNVSYSINQTTGNTTPILYHCPQYLPLKASLIHRSLLFYGLFVIFVGLYNFCWIVCTFFFQMFDRQSNCLSHLAKTTQVLGAKPPAA